jgi:hypothetical protein
MADRFVKQLDGCGYHTGSDNCTCACHGSWLFRATGGRLVCSACTVRRETGDTVGGTNLHQMRDNADDHAIKGYTLWTPGLADKVRQLVLTGRYGTHWNVGYGVIAGTRWDCFEGGFRGAHDLYVKGGDAEFAYYADPGADGRRDGIPEGWQSIPWDLLFRAAAALPLSKGGPTLAQEYGSGRVYALLTPPDPIIVLPKYLVIIDGNTTDRRTPMYSAPYGERLGAISDASYIVTKRDVVNPATGKPVHWYKVVGTPSGRPTGNLNRWFTPNRWMEWRSL